MYIYNNTKGVKELAKSAAGRNLAQRDFSRLSEIIVSEIGARS